MKQIILSKAAAANLLDTAQGLSNVEIKDEMLTVVCAKISRPELSDLRINLFDADKNEYSNEMKLILTSQSCAVSHHVSPVEDYAVVDASELRRALLVLALNTVK